MERRKWILALFAGGGGALEVIVDGEERILRMRRATVQFPELMRLQLVGKQRTADGATDETESHASQKRATHALHGIGSSQRDGLL